MKQTILAAAIATTLVTTSFGTVVLNEPFTYSNGPLVGNTPGISAGTPWFTASGTATQMDVAGNLVNITQTESEDLGIAAAAASFAFTAGLLTSTFNVAFSTLPNATGTYFAHFRDSGNLFRGRVFGTSTGAAVGSFRLGISNQGNSVAATTFIPEDLALSTQYALTVTLDNTTGISSLAIAGVNGGVAVTAADSTTAGNINGFGLRQASNEGILTLDDLVIDASQPATFVPEPTTTLTLLCGVGMLGLLRRRPARA